MASDDKFPNVPDPRVSEIAQDDAKKVSSYILEWQAEQHTVWAPFDEQLEHWHPSSEKRKELERQGALAVENVAKDFRARGRGLFSNADDVRRTILSRLNWDKNLTNSANSLDIRNEAVFKRLINNGAKDAYDEDMLRVPEYLSQLGKRLLQHP